MDGFAPERRLTSQEEWMMTTQATPTLEGGERMTRGGSGDPESALTRDGMLDNITLYWLTNTAASAARFYRENARLGMSQGVVDLPVGPSIFPREIFHTPRSWADAVYPNLIHWNELEKGGHFAAFEQPDLFARELRDFRAVRA